MPSQSGFPSVLVAVVVALCLKASPAAQPAPLTGFDDLVARAMKDWRVPGLAMAVAKDGKIVIERGYGVRQLGQPAPVDSHTLFAIGSTTKAMTAALVGMLVDDKSSPGTTRRQTPAVVSAQGSRGHTRADGSRSAHAPRRARQRRLSLVRPEQFDRRDPEARPADRAGLLRCDRASSTRTSCTWPPAPSSRPSGHKPWAETIRTADLRAARHARDDRHRSHAHGAPNVASPHDIVGGRVRVIENMSVDPVASAGAVWSSASTWRSGCSSSSTAVASAVRGGKRLLGEPTFAELFTPQTIAPFDMYPTTSWSNRIG